MKGHKWGGAPLQCLKCHDLYGMASQVCVMDCKHSWRAYSGSSLDLEPKYYCSKCYVDQDRIEAREALKAPSERGTKEGE